jgi:XTP/dITP diphosphohydrolase
MPLLVVPLAPDDVPGLTVGEWDSLCACERVYFEQAGHPLAGRLAEAGVPSAPVDSLPASGGGSSDGALLGVVCDPDSPRVLELARAGASITSGPAGRIDDLSAASAAPVVRRAVASLGRVAVVMARLRSADGCPWDVEQTHESLVPYLTEETDEVVAAITALSARPAGDVSASASLADELGDLLLQVLFHARIAEQDGRFDIAGVADGLTAKLVRRHPHVFGDAKVSGPADVVRNWEQIKQAETRPNRAL